MPTHLIEVRADFPLAASIVLSAQSGATYAPVEMRLKTGDRATVSLAVPADTIERMYTEGAGYPDYWVNVRANVLKLVLEVDGVGTHDMNRLLGQHPTAETFVGEGQTFQEAPALGRRILDALLEAANTVIRALRYGCGQHWLTPIEYDGPTQNFLLATHTRWRTPGGEWKVLWVEPHALVISGVFMGAADQYLTPDDWSALGRQVAAGDEPLTGFALIVEARQRFAVGDRHMAVIHLSSALEWAVQRFLERHLAGTLPAKSLQTTLKQSHGRLLEDWVLPIARELALDLESQEWPSIKRVQTLRAEAGHPAIGRTWADLSEYDFRVLAQHATSAVSKLLAVQAPKTPPVLSVEAAAGTGSRTSGAGRGQSE